MAAALPFTVSTTGRLLFLSCFIKSPDRRRKFVSDWMSLVMSSMPGNLASNIAPFWVLPEFAHASPLHRSSSDLIYSLFPENPIRYATTHLSGFSGLPGDGLRRRRGAIREPRQERVSPQQRGGIADPVCRIRHVRVALDPHGRLSGQARQEVRADAGAGGGVDRAAECRLWTHLVRALPADRAAGGRGRGHSAGLGQSHHAGCIRSGQIRSQPVVGAVREGYRIAV